MRTPWIPAGIAAFLSAFPPHAQAVVVQEAGLAGQIEIRNWTMHDGLPQSSVNCMATTDGGYLWIGTYGGLVRFDGITFEVFDLASTPELGSNRIYELFVDSEKRLWIGTLDGGVTCYANGRFTHYPSELGAPEGQVKDFGEDAQGIVWAIGRQISRFVGGRFERVWEESTPYWLRAAEGVMWAAVNGGHLRLDAGGAYRCESTPVDDIVDPSWESTLRRVSEREGIPMFELRVTHLDADGQLWCGTGRYGLYCVREAVFELWETRIPDRGKCIASDTAGEIWIGNNSASGVSRYVAGEVVETILGDPAAPISSVRGLLWARDGTLWTQHGRYVTAVHGTRTVLHDLGISSTQRSPMAEAPDGSVWCGIESNLFRIDKEGWSRFGAEDGFESPKRISSIVATRDGMMWVGSQSAVTRWDGRQFTRFDSTDGIPRGYVRAICEAPDGTIWIGTYGGGLGRFDGETCVRYGVEDGIPDSAISAILYDGAGTLWIQCNRGVFALRLDDLASHLQGVSHELPVRLFEIGESQGTGASLGRDGLAVFPVLDGAVALDTILARAPRTLPPKVFIDEFHAGQTRLDLGPPIILGPDFRNIEIDYTAPDLFDPMGLRFRYRLVGYDDDWTNASSRRSVTYTHLPPGTYTFEVAAIDSAGRRSEDAVLRIDVTPTIVETTWFAVLVTSVILGLVLFALRLRVRKISANNVILRAEIEERKRSERALRRSRQSMRSLSRKLITAQDDERKSIARELHDDFTQRLAAIAIHAEMLADSAATTTDDNRHALEAAQMARQLTTDIQQLSRRLHPASLQDLGLVRAARSECDSFMKREGIQVTFVSEDVPLDLQPEVTLAVYRILQEALHNVAKHAAAATIDVALTGEGGELSLSVLDRGRGFDANHPHEGIGLVSMRERALSIAGSLSVQSRIGEGTSVQMRVPLDGPMETKA